MSKIKKIYRQFILKPLIHVAKAEESFIIKVSKTLENNNDLVLDLGAGERKYEKHFHDNYITLDYPTDTNDRNLNRKNSAIYGDGLCLPFKNDTFSLIISTCVLEHVNQPQKLINEAKRVLKNGGLFLLTAPQCNRHHEAPHDYYRFTKFGLNFMLKDFRNVKIKPSNKSSVLTSWYVLLEQWGTKRNRFRLVILAILMNFVYLINPRKDAKNFEHPMTWFVLAQK